MRCKPRRFTRVADGGLINGGRLRGYYLIIGFDLGMTSEAGAATALTIALAFHQVNDNADINLHFDAFYAHV